MSREQRVYAHWKSLKSVRRRNGAWSWTNGDWLFLARTHRMPVRQVKDIVLAAKGPERTPGKESAQPIAAPTSQGTF